MAQRKTIWNLIVNALWIIAGGTVLGFLLVAAKQKDDRMCRGLDIQIHEFNNNFFVDKKDIERTIVATLGGKLTSQPVGDVNLAGLEQELEKNTWIKKAKLFFDNNDILHVQIAEREPVARIFTVDGASYYIDTALTRLPVTDTLAARVQVFTGFPTGVQVLKPADSILLADIRNISVHIQRDSFLMAMIDQIDITSQRRFELIPKIGNHVVMFGDGSQIEQKLERLRLFYQQVFAKAGINYYAVVNVQFEGQVVAKRRGLEDLSSDSLRTVQIMQLIADNAARESADSLQVMQTDNSGNTADSSLINQSLEREEEPGGVNPQVPVTNPAQNRPPPATNVSRPPASRQPHPPPRQRPRAVMPNRRN